MTRSAMLARIGVFLAATACPGPALAEEEAVTFAGPAMGTTYRVTLARGVPCMTPREIHREVEKVIARIDSALSTWREDSDASRFNRTTAGEWVDVAPDLVEVVRIARRVHADSQGAFDITAAPAESGRPVGMQHLESRDAPPSIRKRVNGLAIDLGGIGPGHAVDEIGGRLARLGSADHLVELGGEVRAWGRRADGANWRVRLRREAASDSKADVIELLPGEAVATSTAKPGRSPIDPRTGRVVERGRAAATVRAATCAEADALAVAAVVLGLEPADDGTITRSRSQPSRR